MYDSSGKRSIGGSLTISALLKHFLKQVVIYIGTLERCGAYSGNRTAKRKNKGENTMKKWLPAVYKLVNSNTVRLVWLVLVVTALVLGSGAPLAFGGGSGAGH
jgi:hypothetical protein